MTLLAGVSTLTLVRCVPLFLALSLVCVAACANDAQKTAGSWVPAPDAVVEWVRAEREIPVGAVRVAGGESIQAAIDEAGPGGTIAIEAGVHRISGLQPREGQTLIGESGAVLSGSVVVEGFVERDGVWVAPAVPGGGEERGQCRDSSPACRLPEDLFVGDRRIDRVLELEDVIEETWYLDAGLNEIVLGVDPGIEAVEMSVVPEAIGGQAEGVTISSLVIERFASPAQRGAVSMGRGWTIDNCVIAENHGVGIRLAAGATVSGSLLEQNGQFAMSGGGRDVLIEGNEFAFNGVAGFSPFWAAGATKFVHVQDLVVRGNRVHSNFGPGLWTDGGDDGTLYEDNEVFDNEHAGIKHEISGSAVMRGNVVTGNGFGTNVDLRGAGVLIRESGPVEVVGNQIAGNNDAIVLLQDDGRTNNTLNTLMDILVTGNTIDSGDGFVAIIGDVSDDEIGQSIRFENNFYNDDASFRVRSASVDLARWQEFGLDLTASETP